MTSELDLLVLRAADITALVRFYTALGVEFNKEQHGSGPEHYSGKAGGVLLEIYPVSSGAATTSVRFGFTVSDISSSIAAAIAAGGSVVSPLQDSSWGARVVIADPEGHKVELLQRVQCANSDVPSKEDRMSPDDAERLNVLLLQIQAKLGESVGFIRDRDSNKSSESYRRVVAEVMATVQLDIQERLWRDYPQLRPEFLKGTYKIDSKIYEPPFYELGDAKETK